ncbi:ATP-grasp domain-containing protein [Thalassobellus citreus]|uniref:ATP-grasp domain-containing protein n=1 Tax=Thalassobellus citreus TaxID=3367752 RepID=UPI0037954EE2
MINKNGHISVLLPEASITHTTSLVNCLSEQRNVDIYVISNINYVGFRCSTKITNFAYYPETNSEIDWLGNIEKELKKHSIDLVIPIDTYGVKTLIKYRNKVSFSNKIGLLPNIESFNIADNKALLTHHMLEYSIPFPKTYYYTKEELLLNVIEDFPVLIKPIQDCGGGSDIIKFNDFKELKQYLLNNELDFKFIIQDYIKGYDIDCSVLCEKGEVLAFTIQKGFLSGEREFSPPDGVEFLYVEKLYDVVKKIMKTLNWSGVAHIDMRFDEKDVTYKIIEINPRFWVSLDASVASGVNFAYLYTLKSLKLDFPRVSYNHIRYLNLFGLMNSIRGNKLFIFNLRFIMKFTPIRFYIKDPIPFLYIVFYKFKSLFRV